jgi:hypothetical protein
VTVIVVPLATRGHSVKTKEIANAAAMIWDEELFNAPIFQCEI